MRHPHSQPALRRGMTLVELLLVIGILTILMAITVTSLQPMLQNRKRKEASRIVIATIAKAKARAAETGRPVGLWIQRDENPMVDPTNPPESRRLAQQLYLAETPLPYAGDFPEATAHLWDFNNDGIVDGAQFEIPLNSRLFSTNPNVDPLVREGDHIKFEGRGAEYPIADIWLTDYPGGSGNLYYWIVFGWNAGPNGEWGATGDDNGDGTTGDPGEIESAFNPGATDDYWAAPPPPLSVGSRLKYQILRQPRRTGNAIDLPGGIVVDLTNSGFGMTGLQLRNNNPNFPIVIEFLPSGAVGNVTFNGVTGPPLQPLHLLLGERDQFAEAGEASPLPLSAANANLVVFNKNLEDPDSFWVTISNNSGNITSAPNTFRLVDEGGGPTYYFSTSLAESRDIAREGVNLGAK